MRIMERVWGGLRHSPLCRPPSSTMLIGLQVVATHSAIASESLRVVGVSSCLLGKWTKVVWLVEGGGVFGRQVVFQRRRAAAVSKLRFTVNANHLRSVYTTISEYFVSELVVQNTLLVHVWLECKQCRAASAYYGVRWGSNSKRNANFYFIYFYFYKLYYISSYIIFIL